MTNPEEKMAKEISKNTVTPSTEAQHINNKEYSTAHSTNNKTKEIDMADNNINATSNNETNEFENPVNTGGTGGTGHTGGTGGTGGPGGYGDYNSNFEEELKQANYETLVGATGGIGGIPESPDEIRENYGYDDLLKKLDEEVPKIFDQEFLINKIKLANEEYDAVFEKSNIIVASKAYVAGIYLNQLKLARIVKKHRDWTTFSTKTFQELTKTCRENRMNMASLPGVKSHFRLGVERLAEFARYYNNLEQKDQELLGKDPIGSILGKHKLDMSLPIEETRVKIDAVLEHYKLVKKNIFVEPKVLEDFFKAGHKITRDDSKHMVKIAKEDENAPANYLKNVIAAGGDRTDLIGAPKFDSTSVDKKIKSIDTQVTKLDKSLKNILERGELEGKVDVEAIENLIKRLQELSSTVRES